MEERDDRASKTSESSMDDEEKEMSKLEEEMRMLKVNEEMRMMKLLIDFKMLYGGGFFPRTTEDVSWKEASTRLVESVSSVEFLDYFKYKTGKEELPCGEDKIWELLWIHYGKRESDRLVNEMKEHLQGIVLELSTDEDENVRDPEMSNEDLMFETSETSKDDSIKCVELFIDFLDFKKCKRGVKFLSFVKVVIGKEVYTNRFKETLMEVLKKDANRFKILRKIMQEIVELDRLESDHETN